MPAISRWAYAVLLRIMSTNVDSEHPRLLAASSIHACAEWRGHTLAVWHAAPDVAAVRELAANIERLARLRPGRSTYLTLLRPLPSLPDEEVRRAFVDLGRKVSELLNCIGVAIDGTGFMAAALRALVTGLGMAANIRFPLRSFSSVPEMTAWVRPRLITAQSTFGTDAEVQDVFNYLTAQIRVP